MMQESPNTATIEYARTLESHAAVWQRWEQRLSLAKRWANPYQEVQCEAEYAGPHGERYAGTGFWDGGDLFILRMMFPRPGEWSWRIRSNDPGLDARSGVVAVRAEAEESALYRHGSLGISPNSRYLVHADGTPFLWIGDTTWLGYVRATDTEWQAYIDDRASRGFSVVMTSCSCMAGPDDRTDPHGEAAFADDGMAQWNPAFWRNFDSKIEYANRRGVLVVVAGAAWGNRARHAAHDEVLAFARNLAARLAGNHVAFSSRQDWGGGPEELVGSSGEAIKRAAPLALMTQHPRRIVGEGAELPMPDQVLKHYYHLPSTDFVSVQTGNGPVPDSEPLDQARAARATGEWIAALYAESPCKPVVNLEGCYDTDYHHGTSANQTAMARREGYQSFLAGACGYTSSSYGIWAWGRPLQWNVKTQVPALATGMNRPYARHLGILAQCLRALDWWRLRPDNDRIRNQTDDWPKRMFFATCPEGDQGAAYLPENQAIVLDMTAFSGPVRARWLNPLDGSAEPVNEPIPNHGERRFTKPADWDDALLVLRTEPSAGERGR
ncbi:MAG: DUF4038 domain-containing protein [Kiritimatiellae bacterium]|nr:DUF4038 domain-containing protein [Kiritimatiellia bacterium]